MSFLDRGRSDDSRGWWRRAVGHAPPIDGEASIYKAAFETLAVGVILCTFDGRVVRVNDRLCQLVGMTREQIAARPFGAQVYFQDEPARADALRKIISGEIAEYSAERRYLRPGDGVSMWLRLTVSAEPQPADRERLLVAVVEDISDRKAHDHVINERAVRQQHLAALSASLPGALCIYRQLPDGASKPEFVTAAFANILGYVPQDSGGHAGGNFKNVHPDDVAALRDGIAAAAQSQTPWRAEYRVLHPTKGMLHVEESSAPEVNADGSMVWYSFLQDVTAQKRAEQKLSEQRSLFSSILASALDGVVALDRAQNILVFNAAAERMFKTTAKAVIGRPFANLAALECGAGLECESLAVECDGVVSAKPQIRSMIGRRSDGQEFPIELSVSRTVYGGEALYTAILRDVTERVRDEAVLRQAAAVFENSQEAICIADTQGFVTAVNPSFRRMAAIGDLDVTASRINVLKLVRIHPGLYRHISRAVAEFGTWQGEALVRNKSGIETPQWVVVSTVRDALGMPVNYVVSSVDISRIKQTEKQLNHLALHDTLTGLPNRHMLHRRIARAIEASRHSGQIGALLFIDLDRFKTVNDSLGHQAGDELLRAIARRLVERVRGGDTVARLGGDEFVIVLEDIEAHANAGKIARDLIDLIEQPVAVLGGHEVYVSASIGISYFPKDGDQADDLLQRADSALYLAKESGRGSYRTYDVSLTVAANEKLELESRMRRALLRDEFLLHYQAIIDARTHRVTGVEALIRWDDPIHGFVQPAQFIPLAEETGFIVPLGDWVIREACAQFKAWRSSGLKLDMLSINLSARQFRMPDLPQRIGAVLSEINLDPGSVEFEITESALMEGGQEALKKLDALKALGVQLSIDDFGTGYSSLSCLKRFPLDTLKVDRSFVRDVCTDPTARQITLAIISLAKTLNLKLIAEGVETSEQATFLKREGCDMLQGFLFAKPVAARSFATWLRSAHFNDAFSKPAN